MSNSEGIAIKNGSSLVDHQRGHTSDLIDLIPHRAPFRLIDRVVALEPNQVRAEKRVPAGDPLLADGLAETLLLEALAQTAACLNAASMKSHRGYLVAANQFRFEGRAYPGDTIELLAVRGGQLGALHRFSGEARVSGRVIAAGEMTF